MAIIDEGRGGVLRAARLISKIRPSRPQYLGSAMIRAVLASLLVGMSFPLLGQETKRFDLPSQTLASSLNQIAVSADLQIVFAPQLVEGLKAAALSGQYTAEEALKKLLEPAGLKAEYLDSKTVAVRPASDGESRD